LSQKKSRSLRCASVALPQSSGVACQARRWTIRRSLSAAPFGNSFTSRVPTGCRKKNRLESIEVFDLTIFTAGKVAADCCSDRENLTVSCAVRENRQPLNHKVNRVAFGRCED
jgi:hypothetical protein